MGAPKLEPLALFYFIIEDSKSSTFKITLLSLNPKQVWEGSRVPCPTINASLNTIALELYQKYKKVIRLSFFVLLGESEIISLSLKAFCFLKLLLLYFLRLY